MSRLSRARRAPTPTPVGRTRWRLAAAVPALAAGLLLAGPAAPAAARPGDPDRRLAGDGRLVLSASGGTTAFGPDGRLWVAGTARVDRVRGARIERRWALRQWAPWAIVPRAGGGALAVEYLTVRALAPGGGRDRAYGTNGVARLPAPTAVPRADGGFLAFQVGSPSPVLRVAVVDPAGRAGPLRPLTDPEGRPYENLFDVESDGANGAWVTVFEPRPGQVWGPPYRLVHVGADGAVDPALPRGRLVPSARLAPVRGGVLVLDGTTLRRVAGGVLGDPVRLALPQGGLEAGPWLDAAGRWLAAAGGRLRRLLPEGRRDPAWPRSGVRYARGLPRRAAQHEEPFAAIDGLRERRDGTLDLAVRIGGLQDNRIDIDEVTRAVALVRLEGEDLVRVTSVKRAGARGPGSVAVRCLARAAGRCRVTVQVGRARASTTALAGRTRRVRIPVPRRGRAQVLARARDGRGLVASHRRMLGAG